jgi:hypothetical protein
MLKRAQPTYIMNDEIDEDHFESYFHGLSDYEPEDDFVDFPDFEEDREDYDEPIEDSVWADADALASGGDYQFDPEEGFNWF